MSHTMTMNISLVSKFLLISILLTYIFFISLPTNFTPFITPTLLFGFKSNSNPVDSPTTLSHLAFGLIGSNSAYRHRKSYIESWWRANATRGYLYLDKAPDSDLLPWSPASPLYRVSQDLTDFLNETKAAVPISIRVINGIMEAFKDNDNENLRWLVMGDDDTLFFVDNLVDVLGKYDHRKFYYFGTPSDFIMSNFWFSFNQGFGGAGFVLSYSLAKTLANDMPNCLRRVAQIRSSDLMTMACVADFGVNLSPHNGFHQIDMLGDISGLLSSHPKTPLLSLHHMDFVDPFFPSMNRSESVSHLMKAANVDQLHMLQQTICYHRKNGWSFSIAWGYSVHIYERIMPRFVLQMPIETFQIWVGQPRDPPQYMFNTRKPTNNPCDPHVFFLKAVENTPNGTLTTYARAVSREMLPCGTGASQILEIRVLSPTVKRTEMERAECCDIILEADKARVKYRECLHNETLI